MAISRTTTGSASVAAVLITLTAGAQTEMDPATQRTGPASAGALETFPFHERTLGLLLSSDAVVPPRLDIHPVTAMYNREAIIPPQCYTRTEGRFNPCYVCHQNALPGRENTMNDGDLQLAYSFSDVGLTNQWQNLFEDRSERVAAISDAQILAWIDADNYSELAPRLRAAGFDGYIPDLANLEHAADAFDEEGFAKDGSGWVAFNYKPLPSTFWPTNGSTDDVMIRLPDVYRRTQAGAASRDVYRANLSIVEANIKSLAAIATHPIDERVVERDLDHDGALGTVTTIRAPYAYVGAATGYLLLDGLYPLDTEFLHTVRYVGVTPAGAITNSKRMKEVRYMRKLYLATKPQLAELYREEGYAKDQGYLPGYVNRRARGLDNGMGWVITGFIEDRNGRLRVNTYEENFFCMGCHTSIGATIDKTFSFARKIDGAAGWGYIDLRGMPDAPSMDRLGGPLGGPLGGRLGDPLGGRLGDRLEGEIAIYLERVGGGGEFRSNAEMLERWFDAGGMLDKAAVAAAPDVYALITPSPERALRLNKAYRTIVEDQDYIYGRDAMVTPPANVYSQVDNATAPTLPAELFFPWSIQLDWSAVSR